MNTSPTSPNSPTPPQSPATLTPKQTRFIIEYPKDFNATAAARRAGFSGPNADVMGPRLLRHPPIIAALAQAHAERDTEKKSSLNAWLDRLESIANFNPVDLIEPGTNHLRKLTDLPRNSQHALVIRLKGDRKNPTAPPHIDSITTRDQLRALAMLIKIHSQPKPAPLHERTTAFSLAIGARQHERMADVEHYMAILVGDGHSPAIFAARMNAYYGALNARLDGDCPETVRLLAILLADPATYTPAILASIPQIRKYPPMTIKPSATKPPPPKPTPIDPFTDHDRQTLDTFLANPVLPAGNQPAQQTPPAATTPQQRPATPPPTPATLTPEQIRHLQIRAFHHRELVGPLIRRYPDIDFSPAALVLALDPSIATESIPTNPNQRPSDYPNSSQPVSSHQPAAGNIPTNPNQRAGDPA